MNIDERLNEISTKIKELDSLIDDTLDNEPEAERGTYGTKIKQLFEDASWLDAFI